VAMEDSSFGRLIGVLAAPGKTFRAIAARPTWAVALLVLMLVSGAVWFLAGQRIDYRDTITQSVRQSGRNVTEAQLEPQIEMMEKAGSYIYGLSVPAVVVFFSLLAALLYWVAFKLQGSDMSYKSSLSVNLHAAMPSVVIASLLSLPVILSKESLGYDDIKTGTFLASNLGFLAPEESPAWVAAALASLDFFALWSLVLSIIGYREVARVSTKAAVVTVLVIWLLFVGVRVGWVALFGG
jgi:Yip1 domain